MDTTEDTTKRKLEGVGGVGNRAMTSMGDEADDDESMILLRLRWDLVSSQAALVASNMMVDRLGDELTGTVSTTE